MMRYLPPRSIVCAAVLLLGTVAALPAQACPFCAPSLTLSEQLAQNEAAVLVRWVEAQEGDLESAGTTTFDIVEVHQQPRSTPLTKSQRVTIPRYRSGSPGDLFLLMGNPGDERLEWGLPLDMTRACYEYIAQSPSRETPAEQRLAYFLRFLESDESLIANDAYAEFANAAYTDVASLKDRLPRENVRKWIAHPETPGIRLGLYGLMIGLCGTPEDAGYLEQKIVEPAVEFRLGIDGLMAGYLLLTGEQGLDVLERRKLSDKSVPFSETYAAIQALRFMWEYGEGRIGKDRLRQSMRLLLYRPELADLVITDLARWEDWTLHDRLMEMYGAKEYESSPVRIAIIRYLMVCSKAKGEGDAPPAHAAAAAKSLARLEREDPETFKQAGRFFFLK